MVESPGLLAPSFAGFPVHLNLVQQMFIWYVAMSSFTELARENFLSSHDSDDV